MESMLLSLLVFIIIIGLAYWALHKLAAAFGLPGPITVLIDVILVVFAVIYLLRFVRF